jgi:hypothetical protein
MHGNVPAVRETAISSNSASGSVSAITSASDSENSDWFGAVARALLGKEPGVGLHYITGFPVSSCEKYAAKTEASRRQPPGFFLRELIRAKEGEPFFLALMEGCTAPWWIEFEHAARVGAAAIAENSRRRP